MIRRVTICLWQIGDPSSEISLRNLPCDAEKRVCLVVGDGLLSFGQVQC